MASLLYTSGTTSDPKGVMLSHANLLGEVESVFKLGPTSLPDDAVLGVLPLFHVLSQMANLFMGLGEGREGRLSGDVEYHRTAAGSQPATDHHLCRGAAIFLPDPRAYLQRGSQAREGREAGP